jgi:hypothetical protein
MGAVDAVSQPERNDAFHEEIAVLLVEAGFVEGHCFLILMQAVQETAE